MKRQQQQAQLQQQQEEQLKRKQEQLQQQNAQIQQQQQSQLHQQQQNPHLQHQQQLQMQQHHSQTQQQPDYQQQQQYHQQQQVIQQQSQQPQVNQSQQTTIQQQQLSESSGSIPGSPAKKQDVIKEESKGGRFSRFNVTPVVEEKSIVPEAEVQTLVGGIPTESKQQGLQTEIPQYNQINSGGDHSSYQLSTKSDVTGYNHSVSSEPVYQHSMSAEPGTQHSVSSSELHVYQQGGGGSAKVTPEHTLQQQKLSE